MDPTTGHKLLAYVLRLGDDALILGHRLSEWTARGPFLEEDIAMTNVALDYIGRARFFYSYAAELKGGAAREDDFAYLRGARQFQNHLIFELPIGDFAFTMVRQFLVDQFNLFYLGKLATSIDQTIAGIAEKALKETSYHLRRSKNWLLRLGDGTEESHRRSQNALDAIWGYTCELFEQDALELALAKQGLAAEAAPIQNPWLERVEQLLQQATLTLPQQTWAVRGGRQGYHSEHLGHLLTELQFLHRCYPQCQW